MINYYNQDLNYIKETFWLYYNFLKRKDVLYELYDYVYFRTYLLANLILLKINNNDKYFNLYQKIATPQKINLPEHKIRRRK